LPFNLLPNYEPSRILMVLIGLLRLFCTQKDFSMVNLPTFEWIFLSLNLREPRSLNLKNSSKNIIMGIRRLVREVFQRDSCLVFDQNLDLIQVMPNLADPMAKELSHGLTPLLAQEQAAIILGEI
jgi:hypothetical protein